MDGLNKEMLSIDAIAKLNKPILTKNLDVDTTCFNIYKQGEKKS